MKTHADFVTIWILKFLKINFNETNLLESLKNRPGFPSLFSVKETFNELSLDTAAYQLDLTEIDNIEFPVIAHLFDEADKLVILTGYDDQSKIVSYEIFNNNLVEEHVDQFKLKWSGVILNVTRNKFSGEKNYLLNRLWLQKKKFFVLFAGIAFLSGFYYLQQSGIPVWIALITSINLIGLAISWMLYLMESLPGTDIYSRICRINNLFDCSKVLESGKGNFTKTTTLAEVSVIYFTFSLFLILLSSARPIVYQNLYILLTINFFGIPAVLYSLYLQAFKIKSFCIFCLSITLLFLLGFALMLLNSSTLKFSFTSTFNSPLFFSTGITLLSLILGNQLKLIWARKNDSNEEFKDEMISIPGFFRLAVDNQKPVAFNVLPEKIECGNPHSENIITLVVNPDCFHCKTVAFEIDKVLADNKVKLNFLLFMTEEVSTYIIAISIEQGNEAAWKAYLDYAFIGFETLKKKYCINKESLPHSLKIYKSIQDWCDGMKIDSTPQIYLNQRKIPFFIQNIDGLSTHILNYYS
ncbi:MAG: vitamin K epoxide reductase family protein [Ferruginibacter sp.]